jgi:hypothetical protein
VATPQRSLLGRRSRGCSFLDSRWTRSSLRVSTITP